MMTLKAAIKALALFLLKWAAGDALYLIVPNDGIVARARVLAQFQQQYGGRSGESKRHQVYSQLIKDFPQAACRDIALAIEAALP
jgi:hypothetical protein